LYFLATPRLFDPLGKQQKVYASPFPGSGFYFRERSRLVEEAGADAAFLSQYSTESAFSYMYGTIRILPETYEENILDHLLYSDELFDGTPYAPLRKGIIKLRAKDEDIDLTTNDKGEFTIGGLPAGVYHIEVPGHRFEPEIIFLPENGCLEVNLFIKAIR
jgi:hypothetical protein